jgi:hypothetical protein
MLQHHPAERYGWAIVVNLQDDADSHKRSVGSRMLAKGHVIAK